MANKLVLVMYRCSLVSSNKLEQLVVLLEQVLKVQ